MLKRDNLLLFLGLLIPLFLVFKALLLPGTAVWGDAPYFYPEALHEFPLEPSSWTSWGNNFGNVNKTFWLTPLMFFYGLLYKVFGLTNDALIRIVFYFPAILLSIITPIIFARSLGFGKIVQFFASLFYVFNTYFLLLIDGGQVGVALAYGIFPLSLVYIRMFLRRPDLSKFFLSLIFLSATTSFDPRVGLISVISILVWFLSEALLAKERKSIKNLKWLIPVVLATAAVNSYWFIPLTKLAGGIDVTVSGLQLLSLLNGLFFFAPHWPANEFGKVSPPPFYFLGIPLLVFGGLFWWKSKKSLSLVIVVLFFIFLVKGTTFPLGEVYGWLVANVPFGVALRDSSKFFIPLFLFSGVLVGASVEYLRNKWRRFAWVSTGAVYGYLLFLIHPAILGNLNGVLTQRNLPDDFNIVHNKLTGDSGFFRTAWFPARHPFGFHSEEKSAVDARELVSTRPFASLNVGTDIFNFIHQNDEFLDWFNLMGIKYLAFSGNPRVLNPNQEEVKDWENLTSRVASVSGLVKENWGIGFPVYSTSEVKPHMFYVDKAIFVVGSEDIYQKLRKVNPGFSVGNQVLFFLEDGKFSEYDVYESLTKESGIIVYNDKNDTDLAMTFLKKYFVSPKDAKFSQWATRDSRDYLNWKYELLNNGVDTREFDYSQGIAFSTVPGERMGFVFDVAKEGHYVLAVRRLAKDGNFAWNTEEIELDSGEWEKELTSFGNIDVINTVALIPKNQWDFANSQAKTLVGQLDIIKIDGINDENELAQLSNLSKWHELEFQKINPTNYTVSLPQKNSWLIFTDSYSGGWHIRTDKYEHWSSPAYSELNGFFVHDYDKSAELYYSGQKYLETGEKISLISLMTIAVIWAGLYARRGKT